jgi:DNA-binding transcriptional MerR regulator
MVRKSFKSQSEGRSPVAADTSLKVGTVARCAGVTIRTLRYYEEIGLLSPSGRTEGGHRLYERPDLMRLQQIKSLQTVGLLAR